MSEFEALDTSNVDWSKAAWAQKTASVTAEKVAPGTVLQTVMANGHVETTKTAGPDGGYKTKNPSGEEYIVEPKTFEKRYDPAGPENEYRPKFAPVQVLPLDRDVSFKAPWGEDMFIKAGGMLVNGGGKDIYGIQKEEFAATYSVVSGPGGPRPETFEAAVEAAKGLKAKFDVDCPKDTACFKGKGEVEMIRSPDAPTPGR